MSETNGTIAVETGPPELYRRHRPKDLDGLVGQPSAVSKLKSMLEGKSVPHVLLFSGNSGCGKTSAARILRRYLRCKERDFNELNCAEARGIDTIREIQSRMNLSPMPGGKSRIWLLDECHRLTGDSQGALLKMLEDTPRHVYFMLATTDPQKLLPTIRTRCTEIAMKAIPDKELRALLVDVARKEGDKLTEAVLDKLVECAGGSGRMALVLLHPLLGMEDEASQLNAIQSASAETAAIELARALLAGKKWSEVAAIIKGLANEDPEGLRRMVCSYAAKVHLDGGKFSARAKLLLEVFCEPWYDVGMARSMLTLSCSRVCDG